MLNATAEAAANSLYNRVIYRYGCIASFQSDNGSHFANDIVRCITETLQVHHHFSTPYYPQSNRRVERVVGTLKVMLKRTVAAATAAVPSAGGSELADIKVYGIDLNLDETILSMIVEAQGNHDAVNQEVDEDELAGKVGSVYWAPLLHPVLWVYRSTPHSVPGLSPALLALGRELKLLMDVVDNDPVPITDEDHKACIAKRMC